jgi:hypothetical protein
VNAGLIAFMTALRLLSMAERGKSCLFQPLGDFLMHNNNGESMTGSRQPSRHLYWALLISLSLACSATFAFKLNDGGHGGITRDALQAISVTVEGETLRFSDRAKEEIKDANFEVDHHQLTASFHFDDESLTAGTQRINDLRQRVISEAIGGNGKSARQALGGALHTIQDFFAHSNAAERGDPIPEFGFAVLRAPLAGTATCTGSLLNQGSVLLNGADLTTGYFKIPLCDPPNGKCKHGLFICPGIAKDADDHAFHAPAYSSAVQASRKFIESILNDSRMTADPRAIKRLLDIRPMLGAAIDNTGSMGGVIEGVKSAVTQIVSSVKDTPDEPDQYLLEAFGDPDVGPAQVFNDAASFAGALNGIVASGGGDCPEYSARGTYTAVEAASNDSRLFVYTDASAKDAYLASAVANLAQKKRISITTALSGNCSPYDPAYFEFARKTGGQVFITTRGESGATLASLMAPLVKNDVHQLLQVSAELTGSPVTYVVPLDDTVTQAIFSVGMISKGAITLTRPDGSTVQAGDPGVVITDTQGARSYTINAPVTGNWTFRITGSGTTLVTAAASTKIYLHRFDFVDLAGRTEHQGYFPIEGNAITGKVQTIRSVLFGAYTEPLFSFRRPDGTLISNFSMASGNALAGTKEELIGEVTPPSEPFLVYVTGKTASGLPFQRVLPGQQAASSVEVRSASDLTLVPAGRVTPVVFSVTNYGPASTFTLTALDSKGYLAPGTPSSVTLAADESKSVVLKVAPPAGTPEFTSFSVTLTASAGAEQNSNSASLALAVAAANQAPLCSAAAASPSVIRRVNHKMVPISILGVTDPDSDPVNLKITAITQDEPVTGGTGSGHTGSDASGIGEAGAQVRAERAGTGDGRVYRIAFDADDGKGGTCSGSVKVEVPHDNRTTAVDSGNGYNATVSR